MKVVLALSSLLVALAAGFGAGMLARRLADRPSLPPPRGRPEALAAAHAALERGQPGAALERLATLGEGLAAEDRAEAALLAALARDDRRALFAVLGDHPGTRAAARARWEIFRRTPAGARRDAMRADFARRHPDAWVLGGGAP